MASSDRYMILSVTSNTEIHNLFKVTRIIVRCSTERGVSSTATVYLIPLNNRTISLSTDGGNGMGKEKV